MPISAPDKIITPWATSGLKAAIPETADPVLGRAGFDQGFPAINMTPKTAGGIPPFGQDFNGILFDLTDAMRFLEAGGSFPYDSAWATLVGGYPVGALVSRTDNQGLWRNTTANNLTDPETGGAGWQPEGSGATSVAMTSSNVTLTPLQSARQIIVITGTLTANLQLIFPTYVKQWLVVNNGTGGFSVTCKTAAGSGVDIQTGSTAPIHGDGTNINSSASASSLPPSYLSGYTLANNSGAPTTTIDVSAGSSRNLLNTLNITLGSTFSGILQTSGAWAAGTGQNKLDTGARVANQTYHSFAIRKTSDGTGDILFSLSASAPTMPTGYAGFRRIGSVLTDASNLIKAFTQAGREFLLTTPLADVNATAVGSGTVLYAVSVPTGIVVRAIIQGSAQSTAGAGFYHLNTPGNNDVAGNLYGTAVSTAANVACAFGKAEVRTNTSAQIQINSQLAGNTHRFAAYGWTDRADV